MVAESEVSNWRRRRGETVAEAVAAKAASEAMRTMLVGGSQMRNEFAVVALIDHLEVGVTV
jgi:hypothetical protein